MVRKASSRHIAHRGSHFVGCTLLLLDDGLPSRVVRVVGFDEPTAQRNGTGPYECRELTTGHDAFVGCTMLLPVDDDGNPEETVRVLKHDAATVAKGYAVRYFCEYLDGPLKGECQWEEIGDIYAGRVLSVCRAVAASLALSADNGVTRWETEHTLRESRLVDSSRTRSHKSLLRLVETIDDAATRITAGHATTFLGEIEAFLRHAAPLAAAPRDAAWPTCLPTAAVVAGMGARERRRRFAALARSIAAPGPLAHAAPSATLGPPAPSLQLHAVLLSSHACRDEASTMRAVMEQLRRSAAAAEHAHSAPRPEDDAMDALRGAALVGHDLLFPALVDEDDASKNLPEEAIRVLRYDPAALARGELGPFYCEYLDGEREGEVDWEPEADVYGAHLLRRPKDRHFRATAARAQARAQAEEHPALAPTASGDDFDAPSLFTVARWFAERREQRAAALEGGVAGGAEGAAEGTVGDAATAAASGTACSIAAAGSVATDTAAADGRARDDGVVVIFDDFESFDVAVLNRVIECLLLLRRGGGAGGCDGDSAIAVSVVLGLATSMVDETLARHLGWRARSAMRVRHFRPPDPVAAIDCLFEALIVGSEWEAPRAAAEASAEGADQSAGANGASYCEPLPLWFAPRTLVNLRRGFEDAASMCWQLVCLAKEHWRVEPRFDALCDAAAAAPGGGRVGDGGGEDAARDIASGAAMRRLAAHRVGWSFALRALRELLAGLGIAAAQWGHVAQAESGAVPGEVAGEVAGAVSGTAARARRDTTSRAALCELHIAAQRGSLPALVPAIVSHLKASGAQRCLKKIERVIAAFAAFHARLEASLASARFGAAAWSGAALFADAAAEAGALLATLREAEALAKSPPKATAKGDARRAASGLGRAWSGSKRRRMSLQATSGGGKHDLEQWNSRGVMKASELVLHFVRKHLCPVSDLPLHETCFCRDSGGVAPEGEATALSAAGAALSAEPGATLLERHFAPQMRIPHIAPLVDPSRWLPSLCAASARNLDAEMPDIAQLYTLYCESGRTLDTAAWYTSFASMQVRLLVASLFLSPSSSLSLSLSLSPTPTSHTNTRRRREGAREQ
jgi:hypothetical protein